MDFNFYVVFTRVTTFQFLDNLVNSTLFVFIWYTISQWFLGKGFTMAPRVTPDPFFSAFIEICFSFVNLDFGKYSNNHRVKEPVCLFLETELLSVGTRMFYYLFVGLLRNFHFWEKIMRIIHGCKNIFTILNTLYLHLFHHLAWYCWLWLRFQSARI